MSHVRQQCRLSRSRECSPRRPPPAATRNLTMTDSAASKAAAMPARHHDCATIAFGASLVCSSCLSHGGHLRTTDAVQMARPAK